MLRSLRGTGGAWSTHIAFLWALCGVSGKSEKAAPERESLMKGWASPSLPPLCVGFPLCSAGSAHSCRGCSAGKGLGLRWAEAEEGEGGRRQHWGDSGLSTGSCGFDRFAAGVESKRRGTWRATFLSVRLPCAFPVQSRPALRGLRNQRPTLPPLRVRNNEMTSCRLLRLLPIRSGSSPGRLCGFLACN